MVDFNQLKVTPAPPHLLGANRQGEAVHFALYSEGATAVTLVLISGKEKREFALKRSKHTWHICIEGLPTEFSYGYRVDGEDSTFDKEVLCLDPYAKRISAPTEWNSQRTLLSLSPKQEEFDWGEDLPLRHPSDQLIIYEMHVRGFTNDPSSTAHHPGTYLGVIEKIPYLKELGVTAVELLPIFEFDERGPPPNYWGYSPFHFFCPMARYAKKNGALEFKELVKALHEAGIEVILDVVFNHTGDGGNLQRIDARTYYLLDESGQHTNYSGCGNTLNCNHRAVRQWILSVLRYFAEEMHVDGFRFDLASIFCRGEKGEVLEDPPLIREINQDPLLSTRRLIAEPWDCAGLYQVGSFPGGWPEWNGFFRDTVRRFLKGTDGEAQAFATALLSREDCIQFVTAHDGFTLRDLVSYSEKHNEANGEGNRDGSSCNESWNCGHEGDTEDPSILALRKRQQRNFLLALFMSRGIPMLLMGDEVGHTRQGNNNAYCQDNRLNYFLWDERDEGLFQFVKRLIEVRQTIRFQKAECREAKERFVSFSAGDLFLAFNAHFDYRSFDLPAPSEGKRWHRLVDSQLLSFDESPFPLDNTYTLHPYSSLLLVQK